MFVKVFGLTHTFALISIMPLNMTLFESPGSIDGPNIDLFVSEGSIFSSFLRLTVDTFHAPYIVQMTSFGNILHA